MKYKIPQIDDERCVACNPSVYVPLTKLTALEREIERDGGIIVDLGADNIAARVDCKGNYQVLM